MLVVKLLETNCSVHSPRPPTFTPFDAGEAGGLTAASAGASLLLPEPVPVFDVRPGAMQHVPAGQREAHQHQQHGHQRQHEGHDADRLHDHDEGGVLLAG